MRIQSSAARADVRAFRALYRDHYGFVWSTVQRMGVQPEAIEDAVQDAFLVVFRRWGDLPVERRRAWLYGIARRVSSNARKIERRRARKHDALRHAHARRSEVVGRFEAAATLDRFLAGLDARDRELFVLGAIEGLTGQELAAALGAPASTLYGRLQGLRRQFRADAGAGADAAMERARVARPRASAASWALLLPKLGSAGTGITSGWAWAAGAAAAALVGTVAVARPRPGAVLTASPALATSLGAPPRVRPAPPEVASSPSEPEAPRAPVAAAPSSPSLAPTRRDPLAAEAALVEAIRSRVRAGEGDAALRLVARHARRHGGGALSDVVVALEVEALCDLGRGRDAEARAAALLRVRPATPVAQRLSRGCRSDESDEAIVGNAGSGHGSQ